MKSRFSKLMLCMVSIIAVISFAISGCSMARSAINYEEAPGDMAAAEYDRAAGEYKSGYDESQAYTEEAVATTVAEAPAGDGSSELYTDAGSSDAGTIMAISTKLIKNGYIQIEVAKGKFQEIFFEVSSLAEKYNGYVSSSQSYSDSEGKLTSGSVILRIDKQHFDAVINKIKEMGNVKSVNIYVQDVTQEYVDNESRLTNLGVQQKRLQELMEQSVTVKDSIEVQRELSNVEGQIEIIKGRQNYLDNLIAYSTVEVYISEPVAITETTDDGFIGAVRRGARGALTALRVITMVLIAASPLLVLGAIIGIIIWLSVRAKRRRRARKELMKENK